MAGLLLCVAPAFAQAQNADADATADGRAQREAFSATAGSIEQRMLDAQDELSALNAEIAEQKSPLASELRELEEQLKQARRELETVSRRAANQALEAKRLNDRIDGRQTSAKFIADRFDQYIREFEANLHIAELQRYERPLEDAKLAMENRDLSSRDRFGVQRAVVQASLDRLEEMQGGVVYQGSAIDSEGVLRKQGASAAGSFVQFGPVVLFTDTTGKLQGAVQQRLGTLLPEVVPFANPMYEGTVSTLVDESRGTLALDTTLGEAQVAEQIEEETLEDELRAGGFVMWPLGVVAGLTVLIALYKFLAIVSTPTLSNRKLGELLKAVRDRDIKRAREITQTMRGPSGRMLRAGADHLGAPRELIEEVMYEKVLMAKLKVQRLLPFIAICAAAAPLLGLLGTVSGIINTFKMMQITGGADMQNVSSGISEALITTKYGLIVAIPALILHVFLSRMARGVVDKMEKAGVAFINQVMKASPGDGEHHTLPAAPGPDGTGPAVDPAPRSPSDDDASGEDTSDSTVTDDQEPELVESGAGGETEKGMNPA